MWFKERIHKVRVPSHTRNRKCEKWRIVELFVGSSSNCSRIPAHEFHNLRNYERTQHKHSNGIIFERLFFLPSFFQRNGD